MTTGELRDAIESAFADVPAPPLTDIVEHKCEECAGVQKDFAGLTWRQTPSALIRANHDVLPLFTPQAFHAYLPAFLTQSLSAEELMDYDVRQLTVFALNPSTEFRHRLFERVSLFTSTQIEAIVSFLEFLAIGGCENEFVDEASDALNSVWYLARDGTA